MNKLVKAKWNQNRGGPYLALFGKECSWSQPRDIVSDANPATPVLLLLDPVLFLPLLASHRQGMNKLIKAKRNQNRGWPYLALSRDVARMLSTTRTDKFDNIRPYAGDPIGFTLEGLTGIIGDNPFALVGGTGAIWIPGQATARRGASS